MKKKISKTSERHVVMMTLVNMKENERKERKSENVKISAAKSISVTWRKKIINGGNEEKYRKKGKESEKAKEKWHKSENKEMWQKSRK